MEIKKNPRKQLENFSKIFFQIGIALSLFIIYTLVEHKSYESEYSSNLGDLTMVDELQEDIPIVKIQEVKPPPQKTPAVMQQIKVVEDELKVEESIIETTEIDEGDAVVVNTVDIVEEVEEEVVVEDVPFMLLKDVPIFPGCEGDNKTLKKCFSKKVQQHFLERFNSNLANELGLSAGKKKLYVMFRINQKGNIVNIKSRGPHPLLEKEVERIISALPQMTPGKQRGRPVPVSYSIPITFQVVL